MTNYQVRWGVNKDRVLLMGIGEGDIIEFVGRAS